MGSKDPSSTPPTGGKRMKRGSAVGIYSRSRQCVIKEVYCKPVRCMFHHAWVIMDTIGQQGITCTEAICRMIKVELLCRYQRMLRSKSGRLPQRSDIMFMWIACFVVSLGHLRQTPERAQAHCIMIPQMTLRETCVTKCIYWNISISDVGSALTQRQISELGVRVLFQTLLPPPPCSRAVWCSLATRVERGL